jgi:hypothetical protein
MSPLCQLEMTLPGGYPGVVGGDGSADERLGAFAAGSIAGFGSAGADDPRRQRMRSVIPGGTLCSSAGSTSSTVASLGNDPNPDSASGPGGQTAPYTVAALRRRLCGRAPDRCAMRHSSWHAANSRSTGIRFSARGDDPGKGEHAVHVGAGVGYYTAILHRLVGRCRTTKPAAGLAPRFTRPTFAVLRSAGPQLPGRLWPDPPKADRRGPAGE